MSMLKFCMNFILIRTNLLHLFKKLVSFCMNLQYIRIKVICDLYENEHRTYFFVFG